MTRTSLFIAALTLAITVPATASAHCGTTQGSFAVTCEQGVKVYRHNAMSGIPAPISQSEAYLRAEQIRAKTARAQIQAQSRANARAAELRERELAIEDYRARVFDRTARRTSFPIGAYYNNRGFQFAQPVRIRKDSLNIGH
jgi:hypothetical protein